MSLYVVARMMQASRGRSDKQQQEQTSPNYLQRHFLSSVSVGFQFSPKELLLAFGIE